MASHPLTNKGAKYCRDIVSSKIDACLQVKQACQRQIDDLKKQKDDGFPYRFDKMKAEKVCKFIEMLPHQKGKWSGTRIVLQPWQLMIISTIFGWVKKDNGKRRFSEAVICVPRKSGKSIIAAAIGLYLGFADGEAAAEVYCAATTEKQAFEVHRPMWLMTKMTPAFKTCFNIELSGNQVNPGAIFSMESGSRCNVVVGNPPDGANVTNWIQDEFHESKDSRSYDTGITGMGSREQPLMLVTSTAGVNTSYPFFELVSRVRKILSGDIENDNVFGIEYTIDADDDWTLFENWIKANPSYGVSVSEDFLKKQLKTAMQSPRQQNILKTKHLNVWAASGSAWINSIDWENCRDTEMNLNDFNESPCYVGLDLASKKDIASKMRLFVKTPDGETKTHYYLFSTHYTPSENIEGEDKAHYAGWAHMGHIKTHAGARIDIEEIQEEIKLDAKRFDITGEENAGGDVASDPWNAQQLGTNLLNEGISYVEIPQTAASLSEPMKELEVLIMEGRLHHDGNEVTTWMFQNVFCEPDMKDNIFPRKESKNSNNKIDGAVATINAMARAMYDTGESASAYEDRGILTF